MTHKKRIEQARRRREQVPFSTDIENDAKVAGLFEKGRRVFIDKDGSVHDRGPREATDGENSPWLTTLLTSSGNTIPLRDASDRRWAPIDRD